MQLVEINRGLNNRFGLIRRVARSTGCRLRREKPRMQVSSLRIEKRDLVNNTSKQFLPFGYRGSPASFTRFLLVAIFPTTSNIL